MTRAPSSISSLVIAGFIAAALSVAPVGLDDDFTLQTKTAFAKGKGSGSSSGRGGSNRGGDNRGGSSSSSGSDQDLVKGSGNGQGQNNGQGQGVGSSSADGNHGSLASALGNLNAAHASPTALAHASENSMVGMLALYADAVAGDPDAASPVLGLTLEEQQDALGDISNKADDDGLVDASVVTEVNSLLGID